MITVALVSSDDVGSGVLLGTWSAARLVALEDASDADPVDVVLVDGYAASRTSIDIAGQLVASTHVKAVVLHALHITPALIDEAARARLAGVVGRQVFGPALVDTLVEIAEADRTTGPVVVKAHSHALTERERSILILIGEGRTNDEIAALLSMSVNTVKSSARSVYRKLGVRNRTHAAMLAHRHTSASMTRPVAPEQATAALG
ncbi:MAG: response regulator transcription factor [Ilumatobacteraceae bacterium]